MVLLCLPLATPIGLSPPHILTLCGSERVLVVSTEPPDDLSCLTTPGVGRPGDGDVARAVDPVHPDAPPESMRGFADSSTDLCVCRIMGEGGASSWYSPSGTGLRMGSGQRRGGGHRIQRGPCPRPQPGLLGGT